ncbi:hypothetical protein, partial [Oleiphilus sp. HI0132]
MFKHGTWVLLIAVLITGCTQSQTETVDGIGSVEGFSPATQITQKMNQAVEAQLPLKDSEDIAQSKRGFIATVEGLQVS